MTDASCGAANGSGLAGPCQGGAIGCRPLAVAARPAAAYDQEMLLTLLRHGKAVDKDKWNQDDTERPLTKDGIEQAARAFKAVRRWVEAEEVWTSPWTRARQTAELAADAWKLPRREVPWLAGDAMAREQQLRLLPKDIDVVLVGHEPDL